MPSADMVVGILFHLLPHLSSNITSRLGLPLLLILGEKCLVLDKERVNPTSNSAQTHTPPKVQLSCLRAVYKQEPYAGGWADNVETAMYFTTAAK